MWLLFPFAAAGPGAPRSPDPSWLALCVANELASTSGGEIACPVLGPVPPALRVCHFERSKTETGLSASTIEQTSAEVEWDSEGRPSAITRRHTVTLRRANGAESKEWDETDVERFTYDAEGRLAAVESTASAVGGPPVAPLRRTWSWRDGAVEVSTGSVSWTLTLGAGGVPTTRRDAWETAVYRFERGRQVGATVTDPSGATIRSSVLSRDAQGRVIEERVTFPAGSPLEGTRVWARWTWDDAGRVVQVDDTHLSYDCPPR